MHIQRQLTNAPILATQKPSRNALTLELFTCIGRRVRIISRLVLGRTVVKGAIERLGLIGPELECTSCVGGIAAESYLRWSAGEHVQDFTVCNSDKASMGEL